MGSLWSQSMRIVNSLSTQEWVLVFIAAIIVGVLCLRGFGSRSHY